ncbi:MAG: chlorophyllase/cutinase-like alpha/beta fold protein [Oscillochloridaceae bacterium umkhey_bin13]
MRQNYLVVTVLFLLAILLSACATPPAPAPPTAPPASVTTPEPSEPPVAGGARQFVLDPAEITVAVGNNQVEPLELRGTLAAPTTPGSYPVVLVLHGSHSVCPMQPQSPEEPEICPQTEQIRNDPGLGYLLEILAERGYLALAPDLNTAFRAEFADLQFEPDRIHLVAERQLAQLVAGNPAFGLAPGVEPDLTRMHVVGHSRGGFAAFILAQNATEPGSSVLAGSQIQSLLLIAPAADRALSFAPVPDLPMAVILPECDGDVASLDGQHYLEMARLDPARRSPAISYFLPGANHNFFNAALTEDDGERVFSSCLAETPRLSPAQQQEFLAVLVPDLLTAWTSNTLTAMPGFGLDALLPPTFAEVPTTFVPILPAAQRRAILTGSASSELQTNPLGGSVRVEGADLDFCPYGMFGIGEPCRRGVSMPGTPAQLHLAWDQLEAVLLIDLPSAFGDASQAQAVQLRLVVDPLDRRTLTTDDQALLLGLLDQNGNRATQTVTAAFPPGIELNENWFGHVFPAMVRVPLNAFSGVDLSQIVAITLQPTTPSGAIFLADLELVGTSPNLAGPTQPAPFRSLTGSISVPDLASVPPESSLIVRLARAGGEFDLPRYVAIQPTPVAGDLPLPFTLFYPQAALDERFDYVFDAILQTGDGASFELVSPVPAITAGVPQPLQNLTLSPISQTMPEEVPTDAGLQVTLLAPPGQPFPPETWFSAILIPLDANGMGLSSIGGANLIGPTTSIDQIVLEIPYATSDIEAGVTYAVFADAFAADGFTRLADSVGNVPVDLSTNAITLQLVPFTP